MNRIINTIASVSLAVVGFGLTGCESLGLGKPSTPVTKATETSSDPTGGFSDAGINERAGISRNYAIAGLDDTQVGTSRPTTTLSTGSDTLSTPPKATTTEPSDAPDDTKKPVEDPAVTPEPDKAKPDDTAAPKPDDAKPEAAPKPDDAPPASDPKAAPEAPEAPAAPADEPAKKSADAPAPPPAEENK